MSTPLLAIVTLIYLGVAVDLYRKGDNGMALAFLCYAGANIGLILAAK